MLKIGRTTALQFFQFRLSSIILARPKKVYVDMSLDLSAFGAISLLSGWIGLAYSFPLVHQCFFDHVLCGIGFLSIGDLGFLLKSFTFLRETCRWISNLEILLTFAFLLLCDTFFRVFATSEFIILCGPIVPVSVVSDNVTVDLSRLPFSHLFFSKTMFSVRISFFNPPFVADYVRVEDEFRGKDKVDVVKSKNSIIIGPDV